MEPILWEKEIPKIQNLLEGGLTVSHIARNYGISKQRLAQVIKKFKIKTPAQQLKKLIKQLGPAALFASTYLAKQGYSVAERVDALQILKDWLNKEALDKKVAVNS